MAISPTEKLISSYKTSAQALHTRRDALLAEGVGVAEDPGKAMDMFDIMTKDGRGTSFTVNSITKLDEVAKKAIDALGR
jgi:hypothetical protein